MFLLRPAHGGDSGGPGVIVRQKPGAERGARPAAQRLPQGGAVGPAGSPRAGPGPAGSLRGRRALGALGYQLNCSGLAPCYPVPGAKCTEAAIKLI